MYILVNSVVLVGLVPEDHGLTVFTTIGAVRDTEGLKSSDKARFAFASPEGSAEKSSREHGEKYVRIVRRDGE